MAIPITWLFCPADRPDRFAKALAVSDAVIIDLEDAVDLPKKDDARSTLREAADGLDPARTVVRVNPPGTAAHRADLDMLEGTELRTIMLPKVVARQQIEELAPLRVIALCETVRGILGAGDIATADGCVAITWGAQDLAAEMGAATTRHEDGRFLPYAEHARVEVRFAAAAAGIPALETVWVDIADADGLAAESRRAADEGFSGKLIIHPAHVNVVREAFRPSDDQLSWAGRVLDAAEGDGAASVEGQMIDRSIIEVARGLVERASG